MSDLKTISTTWLRIQKILDARGWSISRFSREAQIPYINLMKWRHEGQETADGSKYDGVIRQFEK